MQTTLTPATFNAVAFVPGMGIKRIATLETNSAMTPDIAMHVIEPFVETMGSRCNASFIAFYNTEDEGLHPSLARGIFATITFEKGEAVIEFSEMPLPNVSKRSKE